MLEGLPMSLARPGPRNCLVWGNSAASDAVVARAFDVLLVPHPHAYVFS